MPPDYSFQADPSSRSSSESLYYDPKTGKWVTVYVAQESTVDTSPEDVPSSATDNKNTTQVDSKSEADKKYIEEELNTLTGDLALLPTEKTLKISVSDTVKLEGFGKYLSGTYFVSGIKRTLNKDGGYSQTLSLLKNGFGDSLKKPYKESESRNEVVPKAPAELRVGDSVKIVGKDATYANSSHGVRVPEWVKTRVLTIQQISSDGSKVLVMPIYSWTYSKYIQKV